MSPGLLRWLREPLDVEADDAHSPTRHRNMIFAIAMITADIRRITESGPGNLSKSKALPMSNTCNR